MTDLVARSVPGDRHGYRTVTTTWRPARPGDTPGELVPEHGPTQPVDLRRCGRGAAPTTTEGVTR